MSSRTRLVMLSKLPFKSFTCCIDNLPHIFHNLKIFFSQGRVFLSVQLTLSLWEILTMSTLRERSLTECFLQKKFTFSTNTPFVKIEPISTCDCWKHAFAFLCNTDCFKKGDTGYRWRGWKWFFSHEQSKLLQIERSEC